MTNIAVCFYGLLRTNKIVSSTLKENLINPLNADVFICCPNVFFAQKNQEHQRSQDEPETVKENYLINTYGHNLKNFNIIAYNTRVFRDVIRNKNLPETTTLLVNEGQENQWEWTGDNWRSLSMFYQIKNVINLCKSYENKRSKKYNTIVLLRPDLIIRNKIDLSELNLNKVITSGDHLAPVFGTDRKVGDHLIVSKRDNIIRIGAIYDNIANLHKNGVPINNESLLGHFLIKNSIEFEYSNKIDHTLERGDVP